MRKFFLIVFMMGASFIYDSNAGECNQKQGPCYSQLADAYKGCHYSTTGDGDCNSYACGQLSGTCKKDCSYWCQ